VIFAVLDVSLAVNLCINCSFFYILYLQFYYVSVADAPGLLLTPGLPLLIIGLDRVDENK